MPKIVDKSQTRIFVRDDGLEALSSGPDDHASFWDLATLECKFSVIPGRGRQLALGYWPAKPAAVVVARESGLVLLDDATADPLRSWKDQGKVISGAWLDPSTGRALAQSGDETWFWDLAANKGKGKGKPLAADPKLVPQVAALHPGVDRYAFGTKSSVGVRAVRASQTRWIQSGKGLGAASLCWAPGGAWLLRGSPDGAVGIHEPDSRVYTSLLGVHPAAVVVALVSRDGKQALTASRDGTVKRWDILRGQLKLDREWKAPAGVTAGALLADGRVLLALEPCDLAWSQLGL